jgi:aminoglycoside 6'-N-acetyltransferase I
MGKDSIPRGPEPEKSGTWDLFEVRVLGVGDHALLAAAAPGVFDSGVDEVASKEFLADARHHITVAIDAGVVVGLVSAVHYVHPDKPRPELWVNEVCVAPTHHRRGIGRALMSAMLGVARRLGCSEAWVLTDRTNGPAMSLYESVGGVQPANAPVLFEIRLQASDR